MLNWSEENVNESESAAWKNWERKLRENEIWALSESASLEASLYAPESLSSTMIDMNHSSHICSHDIFVKIVTKINGTERLTISHAL